MLLFSLLNPAFISQERSSVLSLKDLHNEKRKTILIIIVLWTKWLEPVPEVVRPVHFEISRFIA